MQELEHRPLGEVEQDTVEPVVDLGERLRVYAIDVDAAEREHGRVGEVDVHRDADVLVIEERPIRKLVRERLLRATSSEAAIRARRDAWQKEQCRRCDAKEQERQDENESGGHAGLRNG